jgi:hypothetical protein
MCVCVWERESEDVREKQRTAHTTTLAAVHFSHCNTFTCYTKEGSHFRHIASYLRSSDLCLASHVMHDNQSYWLVGAGSLWCVTSRKLRRPGLNFDLETRSCFLTSLYTLLHSHAPHVKHGNVCAVEAFYSRVQQPTGRTIQICQYLLIKGVV